MMSGGPTGRVALGLAGICHNDIGGAGAHATCVDAQPGPFSLFGDRSQHRGRDSIPFAPFISLLCVMESRVEPGRVLVKLGSADC